MKLSNQFKFFDKNFYLALVAGILHGLGYAPFNIIFAAISSIIIFYIVLTKSENLKQAINFTLIFGTIYYIFSLHWIVNSLLIEVTQFWYLVPLVLLFVPLFLALYFLIIAIPSFYLRKNKIIGALIFTLFWVISEIIRSYFFTGFPWNLIGTIWLDYDFAIPLIQNYGIFFLGGLTILFSAFLANVIFFRHSKSLILLMILIIFTFYPRAKIENTQPKGINFRLIHPNIKQKIKWHQGELDNILQKNLELSLAGEVKNIDYIIWPETSLPFSINIEKIRENIDLQYLVSHLNPKQNLITGALVKRGNKIFNSILVVNYKGEIIDFYDKKRLVPFGEFIPFHDYLPLPFLNILRSMIKDFIHLNWGDDNKSSIIIQEPKALTINPMICYEAIFPCKLSIHNYDVIINIVNDAWFGDSFGPYQHLRLARVRAIEANRPLLRVANSGITAYIDNRGHIVQKLALNTIGYLDVKL